MTKIKSYILISQNIAFNLWFKLQKRYRASARVSRLRKEKSAVRDVHTAGVELADGLEPPTC